MKHTLFGILILLSIQAFSSETPSVVTKQPISLSSNKLYQELMYKKNVIDKLSSSKHCLIEERKKIENLQKKLDFWKGIDGFENEDLSLNVLKRALHKHIKKYNSCDKYIHANQKYKNSYESFYFNYLNDPITTIKTFLAKDPASDKLVLLHSIKMKSLLAASNITGLIIYCISLIIMGMFFIYINKKNRCQKHFLTEDIVFTQRISMILIFVFFTFYYLFISFITQNTNLQYFILMNLCTLIIFVTMFNILHLSNKVISFYKLNPMYPSLIFLSLLFLQIVLCIRHIPLAYLNMSELYTLLKISPYILIAIVIISALAIYKLTKLIELRYKSRQGRFLLLAYTLGVLYAFIKCGISFEVLNNFTTALIIKAPIIMLFLIVYFTVFHAWNNISYIKSANIQKFCQYMNITKENKFHEFYILSYVICLFIVSACIIQISGEEFREVLFSDYFISGLSIRPKVIYSSIIIFFIIITIARILSGIILVKSNCLVNEHLDSKPFKYKLCMSTGLFIATILSLWVAKISLTGIFIVLGALSVGIGIGLKNIINNLISGIILIFEKPIHIGDYICIGKDEGVVTKINLRSTQIKTLTNYHMLIPNELVITEVVSNFYIDNTSISIPIVFEISRNEDIEKVKRIINEVMSRQPDLILKDTEGNSRVIILLKGVSPYGIKIKVLVDIKLAIKRYRITSALYQDLIESFAKEGIVIPTPPIVALPYNKN